MVARLTSHVALDCNAPSFVPGPDIAVASCAKLAPIAAPVN